MSAVTAKNIGELNIQGPSPGFLSKLKSFSLDSLNLSVSPWILFGIFAILVLVGGIYISNVKNKIADPKNVKTALDEQRLLLQDVMSYYAKPRSDVFTITRSTPKAIGDQVQENENSLINYCPLTVQDTGYLGPTIDGTFAERDAVQMALRAGARSFVLNIDFHTEQFLPSDLFGLPNQPCLLYRDLAGTIRSLNAGQIRNVTQALADFAFSNTISNKNDPLYVILYFRRTPQKGSLEYVQFLSKVAEQLEPLIPYHLGQTSEGDYHRQAKQSDIFYLPISRFEKKVLIFCNADTSVFRLQRPGFTFAPTKDLDYLTHVRIFKESTETFGVTDPIEQNIPAKATVDTVSMYTIVPPDKKKSITDNTKLRWSIALSDPGKNPSATTFAYLQDELGVQCMPLWFYEAKKPDSSVLKDMQSNASGAAGAIASEAPDRPTMPSNVNVNVAKPDMTPPPSEAPKEDEFAKIMIRYAACGIRPKAKAVRFVRPSTFTPQAPSTRMDGNQGRLTTPTM